MRAARQSRGSACASAVAIAIALAHASPATAADRRVEAAAQDALKKAATDYLETNFATGSARLGRALRSCGANRCTPATRAALLRDLGTMQFRSGDVGAARATWAEALRLAPDLALNPDYDSADLRAAFDAVRGRAAPAAAAQPAGDFAHSPVAGQKVGVPIPVYAEASGSTSLARVIVKYRGPGMSDWARIDLARMDRGWGGVIPCAAVTRGVVRYWLQGFDEGGDPVANGGDPAHPFTVPVTDEVAGEPPHLPGKPPPAACSDAAAPAGGAAAVAPTDGDTDKAPSEPDAPHPPAEAGATAPYARIWFGVTGMLDFLSLPAGQDVCALNGSAQPANPAGYVCTNPSGSDFPSTTAQNGQLTTGHAGSVPGGVQPGNVRVMASFDYALSASVLLGARAGYVLNTYPGSAAVNEGREIGPKIDLEARLTWLLGTEPLATIGFAPMVFGGAGASAFDGATTTLVVTTAQQPVNAWLTSGPFFADLGGGIRYAFSRRAALTLAARLNTAFGSTFLATYGPEAGVQYGF